MIPRGYHGEGRGGKPRASGDDPIENYTETDQGP